MSEPHIHLGPAPPRAASLHPAILISGVPDSGKRTLAKALLRLPSECPPSHRVLTIRTRETLLLRSSTTPTHPTTHPPVSEADFLLLIVDATRPAGLGELRETLARLPVEWWEALVVVVTKVDSRSRRAVEVRDVGRVVEEYSRGVPVVFSSLSSLATTARRIRRLVLDSTAGKADPMRNLARFSASGFESRGSEEAMVEDDS